MLKNRIIYAVVAVVFLLFSIIYQTNFSSVLLLIVLLYLPIAAVFTLISLLLAKVNFSAENYIGEKNKRFDIEIEVKNRFLIPFVPIEIVCIIPDNKTGLFEKRRIFATLQPLGKTELALNCRNKYRGLYKATIDRIYVVDPLGVLRFSRKIGAEMPMQFLPRRFSFEDIFWKINGETVVSVKSLNSAEKEDFSHVRNYREGDILQLVHWKLTAKSDEIMIKEYENISDRQAKILCDFNSCAGKSDVMLCSDTVIETALAFTKSLLSADVKVTVNYGGLSQKNDIPVRTNADYEQLFELFAELPTEIEARNLNDIFEELRAGEQSIIVIVTAEMTEKTVITAKSAVNSGAVIIAYINPENSPLARDYSGENFAVMNICGSGQKALDDAAIAFRNSYE